MHKNGIKIKISSINNDVSLIKIVLVSLKMTQTSQNIIFIGRVQGVGFRYFTHRVAQQLGVRGRVKNLPNGTVEVYAEGDEDPMEQFLTGIKKGPSLGFVKDVEVGEAEPEGYQDFSIGW